MAQAILPFVSAWLLGSLHAFGADHVAAVTTFAAGRPRARDGLRFGALWGAGHGAALVLLGLPLAALGTRLPAGSSGWLERLAGATLIGLGFWAWRSARSLHAHAHTHPGGRTHVHLHSHARSRAHDHGHAAAAVGAVHGLAGVAPALALLPITGLGSFWAAAACLLLFAGGTASAMALYAAAAGAALGRAAARSAALARGLASLTGFATAGIGILWLIG